jgi:hypothetical protein
MRFSGDSLSRDLIGKLPPQISVHVLRIRDDSDSAKIESVCIPAGSDGGIRMVRGLRVPDACRLQQIELRILQLVREGINSAPTAVASGTTAGTAVFNWITYAPASVYQSGGLSSYGTMGQGGNVNQLLESAYSGSNTTATATRVYRGGAWGADATALQSSFRGYISPDYSSFSFGFRVARILP